MNTAYSMSVEYGQPSYSILSSFFFSRSSTSHFDFYLVVKKMYYVVTLTLAILRVSQTTVSLVLELVHAAGGCLACCQSKQCWMYMLKTGVWE